MKHKLTQGLIQIYTGNGKGKTTAAIGLANRAAAAGLKVTFIQFLKAGHDEKTIRQNQKINYYHFGLPHEKYGWLTIDDSKTTSPYLEKFQQCVNEAWQFAKEIIKKGECDLLILDELNVVFHFKLLDVEKIINTLQERATHLEIVITGRSAPQKLLDIADLVTEMKEIKHPYQQGFPARQGIDY